MSQSESIMTVDHDTGAAPNRGAVPLLAGARHRRCPASRVEVARLASPFLYHARSTDHAFFSFVVSGCPVGTSAGTHLGCHFWTGRHDFPQRGAEVRVPARGRENTDQAVRVSCFGARGMVFRSDGQKSFPVHLDPFEARPD